MTNGHIQQFEADIAAFEGGDEKACNRMIGSFQFFFGTATNAQLLELCKFAANLAKADAEPAAG